MSPPEQVPQALDDPPDLGLMLRAAQRLLEDITQVWEERSGQLDESDALRAAALLRAVRRYREAHSDGG